MKVRDAMTARAVTVGPDETIQAAARRMKEAGVGALAVCERDDVVGLLTDRDIVVRSVAEGRDPTAAAVRGVMTAQVIECLDDDDLADAATRMEGGAVRRIVVRDAARRLVGLLSVDDVALFSRALAGEIIEHNRVPERPIQRGPWPWWE